MTTISYNYKDKEIAVDSRETAGDLIASDDAIKAEKISGEWYISAGCSNDCELLTDCIINGTKHDRDLDANVMFTKDGKVFNSNYYAADGLTTWELKRNYTMGTGERFALAAMDFGKSASDAVKYAMTRDIYTGGKIRVIKVK